MLTLAELFAGEELLRPLPEQLAGLMPGAITDDSREVTSGSLYFAVVGGVHDGHRFLAEAFRAGAIAAVTEGSRGADAADVPQIVVRDARRALARVTNLFRGNPSAKLQCVAVTGTNGKTSVSWILAQLLRELSGPTLLCGTLGAALLTESADSATLTETGNTTPGTTVVQRLLEEAHIAGAKAAVMEATSIGLVHNRTLGVQWDAAVFTNLTRDHLDMHGTMEAYGAAKELLFTGELATSEKAARVAVLNIDDPFGEHLVEVLRAVPGIRVVTYSIERRDAEIFPLSWEPSFGGTTIVCSAFGREFVLKTLLIGRFNVSNVLAAVATMLARGYAVENIVRCFELLPPVPGRLEVVPVGAVRCVVDYAHTPDALIQIQRSLREVVSGRLVTVFGCGGDRDRGKRPLMGEAVAALSDYAVVTSDNPRSESPEAIIADIVPGLVRGRSGAAFSWASEPDRRLAIRRALEIAKPGDTVLIAGKGHEAYQEIKGVKYPFSDQEECRTFDAEQANAASSVRQS